MATVTNKREVLSVEDEFKVMQETENGKKEKKSNVYREFYLVDSTIPTI
jgi:hypothetical protein